MTAASATSIHVDRRTVGPYTVRELTLGEIMDLREANPGGGNALTLAMMGLAVEDAQGQPIGVDGARAIRARLAKRVSDAVGELNGDGEGDGDAQAPEKKG